MLRIFVEETYTKHLPHFTASVTGRAKSGTGGVMRKPSLTHRSKYLRRPKSSVVMSRFVGGGPATIMAFTWNKSRCCEWEMPVKALDDFQKRCSCWDLMNCHLLTHQALRPAPLGACLGCAAVYRWSKRRNSCHCRLCRGLKSKWRGWKW